MHAATRATTVEAVTTRLPPRAFPVTLSFARDAAEPRALPLSCWSPSSGAGLDDSGAYFGGGGGGALQRPVYRREEVWSFVRLCVFTLQP